MARSRWWDESPHEPGRKLRAANPPPEKVPSAAAAARSAQEIADALKLAGYAGTRAACLRQINGSRAKQSYGRFVRLAITRTE